MCAMLWSYTYCVVRGVWGCGMGGHYKDVTQCCRSHTGSTATISAVTGISAVSRCLCSRIRIGGPLQHGGQRHSPTTRFGRWVGHPPCLHNFRDGGCHNAGQIPCMWSTSELHSCWSGTLCGISQLGACTRCCRLTGLLNCRRLHPCPNAYGTYNSGSKHGYEYGNCSAAPAGSRSRHCTARTAHTCAYFCARLHKHRHVSDGCRSWHHNLHL